MGLQFTTFRLPRKDKAVQVGEVFQVVIKPRTKGRLPLGEARVISIEEKEAQEYGATGITDSEARKDGFVDSWGLRKYLFWNKNPRPKMAFKLTLEWTIWYRNMIAYTTGDKTLEQIVLDRLTGK